MSGAEHMTIDDYFNKALDLDGDAREAFLTELETDHPEAVKEVRRMVDEFESMDDLFEKPLMPEGLLGNFGSEAEKVFEKTMLTMSTESPTMAPEERLGNKALDEPDPTMIGPYKVLRKIGEGGMGLVYMVEQDVPRRNLALKILTRHRTTMELRARFEAEYGVMAMMTHPNIAALHDTGTTEHGDIYFTMEYVEGMPITQYCKHKKLSLRERLVLFQQVCEGVIHAHQKAVLHRDLKPSNIMVTEQNGRPIVKIIDFGISKMTEQPLEGGTFETRQGTLMGTLEYMSHEQLTGKDDMDTRSDVFSLGVLLYELLTGLLPLRKKGADISTEEVLRYYRETEAPAPSYRLRKVKNIKEHMIHVGYEDGSSVLPSLGGDLDWVILKAMAKEADRRYQTVSEYKRDLELFLDEKPVLARPPSMTYLALKFMKRNGALVASASMILMAMIVGLVISIRANFRVSIAKMETEKTLRQYQATNEILSNMLEAADPKQAGANAKVIDVLAGAEELIQELDPNREGYEEIESNLRTILGNTFYGLDKYAEARDNFQRSYELKSQTLGEDHPKTLRTRFFLGKALRRLRKWSLSEKHLTETLEAQERVKGKNHIETLETKSALATLKFSTSAYNVSFKLYSDVIRELEGRSDDRSLQELGKNLNGLAGVWKHRYEYDRAEQEYKKALKIQLKLLGEEHPETVSTMFNYADSLRLQHSYKSSKELFQRVHDIRSRILGKEHSITLSTGLSLGDIFLALNEYQKAFMISVPILNFAEEKSLRVRRRSLRLAARGLNGLGETELSRALFEDLYHLSMDEKASPDVMINTASHLGIARKEDRDFEASLEVLSFAWAVHLEHKGLNHQNTSYYALFIAQTHLAAMNLSEAEDWFCQAQASAANNDQFWEAAIGLAELKWLNGKQKESELDFETCISEANESLAQKAKERLEHLQTKS